MKPGASLLGVVREDGHVEWAPPGIVVDAEFVEVAREGRDPMRRFRFSNKCKERGCAQWKGDHCGVAEAVLEHADDSPQAPAELPPCAIRAECRWFFDRGPSACALCPEVVTNKYVEASA